MDTSRPRPEHRIHAARPHNEDRESLKRNLKVLMETEWTHIYVHGPSIQHMQHAWPDIQHDRRGDDDIDHLQPNGERETAWTENDDLNLEATTSEQPNSAGDQATTQRRHHRRHLERRHRRRHQRQLQEQQPERRERQRERQRGRQRHRPGQSQNWILIMDRPLTMIWNCEKCK